MRLGDEPTELAEEDLPDSAAECRRVMEHTTRAVHMLERSNAQLRLELCGDSPDDADFLQALAENEAILVARRRRLVELGHLLAALDPAFRLEREREARERETREAAGGAAAADGVHTDAAWAAVVAASDVAAETGGIAVLRLEAAATSAASGGAAEGELEGGLYL